MHNDDDTHNSIGTLSCYNSHKKQIYPRRMVHPMREVKTIQNSESKLRHSVFFAPR